MDAMKHFTEGMIKENKPQFEVGDTVRVSVPFTGNCRELALHPALQGYLPPQGKAKAEKIFVFLSKPPCQTRCTML